MKTPKSQSNNQVLDEWLVLQLQAGDEKALRLLFKRWNKKLIRQANWYTRDLQVAQDIAQEVWMVIVKDILKLSDPSKYGSWALTIATRKAIDWLRAQKKDQQNQQQLEFEATGKIHHKEETNEKEKKIKAVQMAMKCLDADQQSILSLYYSEGNSIHAIAKILNVPPGTVKSRLFYARNKLKQKIKTKYHEDK